MIMVMDTETRGLFGEIFLLGVYDGTTYRQFFNGKEFLTWILEEVKGKEEPTSVYCFNLDFDLAKLFKVSMIQYQQTGTSIFEIDYKNSLIIDGRFHNAKLVGLPLVFRDLYRLVNCSLEKAAQDFGLTTQKMEIQVKDKERYFKTVSPHNAKVQQYLKQDVMVTWELLETLITLTGLELEVFTKCPTTASLAMAIFRTQHGEQFEKIKTCYLSKADEEFIRQAYYGGRTEVFRHKLEGEGFHYDINSLYPHMMESKLYPVGGVLRLPATMLPARRTSFFHDFRERKVWPFHYFLHAKVYIPAQHVGPLPVRDEKRGLMFPKGIFTGHFCAPEMEYALEHCGVEVLEVYDLVWFAREDRLFDGFIATQKEHKLHAKGAKKTLAKLLQNSLYGKFGMNRKREAYELYTPTREKALLKQGKKIAVTNSHNGTQLISYIKYAYGDYIRPQYAALIASWARVELLKKLRALPPEHLYYCDTDSVVSGMPFPAEEVDAKVYGKWKLEREVVEGIFVLPKLYAEVEKGSGQEILKSKGIIQEYQRTVTYTDYLGYYESMRKGQDQVLYGYGRGKSYYQRRKLMNAIKHCLDPDEKVLLQKQLLFSSIHQKRVYDFVNNTSHPIDLTPATVI